ncbi:hypothetical protein HGH93_21460 [Chitinophaga polysaccharea]|uniref:hypothetical protein n=1 Tax=Chitinophaga polysaccharea TaxID=1293035 RepID=UPI0014557F45|nr:hypothetical protein [Chitinophaga polysaccharea]NLR60692.1 hypothetical protein [Chitinophaga polysaccharea]
MLQTIPGFTGYKYGRYASMDGRAIGKFTDSNHLSTLRSERPADYDKKIIDIYTQSQLYSNDFLNMINKATPYYIEGNTDSWQWEIAAPFLFPVIVEVAATTLNQDKIGIDGKEFHLILDSSEFAKNSIIVLGHKMFGPRLYVTKDPQPYNGAYLYEFTLVATNPRIQFLDKQWILPGTSAQLIDVVVGEFDQDLGGLPRLGRKIKMYDSLGSSFGFQHKNTKWADQRVLRDSVTGKPLDILYYAKMGQRGELPTSLSNIRWEPTIEFLLRKQMLETKVQRMIWNTPGSVKTSGNRQELKKISGGIYYKMKHYGNYFPYNKGELSPALIRSIFGDLFYRRVEMAKRKVIMFTNEAGFDVFNEALKQDLMNMGLTVVADSRFIEGSGQNMSVNYGFNSMVSRETGRVELKHLQELDLPQHNREFGQNKKSTPIFMVFDVSPDSDGTFTDRIREVRQAGAPSMTFGYINGRQSHLGHQASQGMDSASMDPSYMIWMEDRADIFIEDMSRTVLIEEIPQY